MKTADGERFLDVAELDDVFGIIVMVLIFAILPVIQTSDKTGLWVILGKKTGVLILKLIAFGIVCLVYSRFFEKHVTVLLSKWTSTSDMLIGVVATALMIAGLSGTLGFSMAIGGFFAGLVYSRDPERVKMDRSLSLLYDLFVPFFFISVGFSLQMQPMGVAFRPVIILTMAAGLGKLIADGLPALAFTNTYGAVLLGISMIPRAEISLLIAQRAYSQQSDLFPEQAFTSVVLTSAITILFIPVILKILLDRRTNSQSGNNSEA